MSIRSTDARNLAKEGTDFVALTVVPTKSFATVGGMIADLLVEQMGNEGIYEWTRRQAEALVKKTAESSKPSYAIGSVEHMIEIQKAGGS